MGANDDLICFSHERWSREPQRIHHLMAQAAQDRRVFFVEAPRLTGEKPQLEIEAREHGVIVVRPTVPEGMDDALMTRCLGTMMKALLRNQESERYALWFGTPMAMPFACELEPSAVIYDLGGDLPETAEDVPGLAAYHAQLLAVADMIVIDDETAVESLQGWTASDQRIAV
jgi:hypothetical protein